MPAYDPDTLVPKGYEILLRCPSPMNVGLGPDVFIPIAENKDIILAIDL
jgi:EAL domain-containing protein (putative c-di-GMP-specific phosphodiesterase class I)